MLDPISSPSVSEPIPKLIWQTAKNIPHPSSHLYINTWIDNNPDYQWLFMDDERCDRFIRDNFNRQFYDMYSALPLGVMKADVWRVAVVYAYGGVYVDTDCECNVPISQWLGDHSLVVATENELGLANFAFAAIPRHPALLSVLERFLELANSPAFMDMKSLTPVQSFGQLGFSEGVLNYCRDNDDATVRIFTVQERRFTNGRFPTSYISHYVASQNWHDYDSWRLQENALR